MSRRKKKQCSRNSVKKKYQDVLKDVQYNGYEVIHKKLPKDVAGYFNPDTCEIEIDKSIENTLDGCYTLLHEFYHANDYRGGKYKKFFAMDDGEIYSDAKLELIIEAELSAAKQAQKRLRVYGIDYTPVELTKQGYKDCIKFWKKYYFRKN